MKKCLLAITFAGAGILTHAQSDFRRGFLVQHSGDTLSGWVEYDEGLEVYRSCEFKTSESSNPSTYGPDAIAGYGIIGDRFFESRKIEIDKQLNSVFLEVIVRGKLTLYKHSATFYIQKEKEFFKLEIKQQETEVNGRAVTYSKEMHIGILKYLTFDCPKIQQRVSHIRLLENSLSKLVEDYNKCVGAPYTVFRQETPWLHTQIGVEAGINFSTITFPGLTSIRNYPISPFETVTVPVFALVADFQSPRRSERFSFGVKAQVFSVKYHSYTEENIPNFTHKNYINVDQTQLKIPLGLRYTFSSKGLTPYFIAGFSGTFLLQSSIDWLSEAITGGVVQTFQTQAVTVSKFQLGFWSGAGIQMPIGKLSYYLEFRYDRASDAVSSDTSSEFLLKSNSQNIQVIFGLKKR